MRTGQSKNKKSSKRQEYLKQQSKDDTATTKEVDGWQGPDMKEYEELDAIEPYLTDEVQDKIDQLGDFDFLQFKVPKSEENLTLTPVLNHHTGMVYEGQWRKGMK